MPKASPWRWKSCAQYAHYGVTLGSRCKMASSHRVTDLEKIPVRISKDEAPTPLSVVGPLFISSLLFHLSWASLRAWRFSLFRSVYSSFHNRLDLIREPAFYWVFYCIFPIYPCLHMQKWNRFVRLGFGVGLVTGSCHSLFFLVACPFVSRDISFI